MFDLPDSGNKAVLVHLDFAAPDPESLSELMLLASSARLKVVAVVKGSRARPDAATFAGSGKVQEIAAAFAAHNASLVIFNHELSPAQERNLEQALQARVIDRVTLILGIFGQRAKSAEGKLQVELAQLTRMATRLKRGWTHLERQRGGFGFTAGPGEKQIEIDRRLLANRVGRLKEKLRRVRTHRALQRAARSGNGALRVSLVGYTNAGKSTLFNRLTRAKAYTADKLFATLDTTTRRVFVDQGAPIVLSDTVGFIRDLPHALVAAFRATLEETIEADLLLHVVDSSSPARDRQIEQVNAVLREIGADAVPQLMVFNKIDQAPWLQAGAERDEYGTISSVRLSALTGEGIDHLRAALAERAPKPTQLSAHLSDLTSKALAI